ncbi:MAG: methyl-accepting chemotaxis protein [Crocosphaera sp.]|nr:methyl-accepting chemotaxis protein [Crocosphaera sp.]
MKISTQMRLCLAGVTVTVIGSAMTLILTSIGDTNAHRINETGVVRGGTQRLVKLELSGVKNDQLIQKLDAIIDGLQNGNKELGLPKSDNANFLSKMEDVKKAWLNIKDLVQKTRENPQHKDELLKASEALFETTDAAVNAAEEIVNKNENMLLIVKYVVIVIDLLIIAGIIIIVQSVTASMSKFSGNIASSSTQIVSTVQEQERVISLQANSINETTTTMDELGAASRQAAEQAIASSTGAQTALSLVEEGTQAVQQTMAGMNMLKDQVREIAEQIMRLSEQTGQIAGVSELVADLANQTNMLALNAAVEAARAGEQGKGFAVVAGEIRKLADESKNSADKINNLVIDIQAAMNSTVMVTDQGTKKTDEGIKLTEETAHTFAGVTDAVNTVFLNSQQISLSAKKQAVAVQQVLSAMNAINLGAQETSVGINQVKSSTDHLKEAAQELQAAV